MGESANMAGFGIIAAGGPVLWLLIGVSTVALALVISKCLHLAGSGIGRWRDTEAALAEWRRGKTRPAVEALEGSRDAAAPILREAMTHTITGHADDDVVREEVLRHSLRLISRLRAGLRPLDLIAQLSPLLGLLGTVLGMIEAFRQLASAGATPDPALLSGGIWEALLTTAAGLIVAIPALSAHAWLEARIDRFREQLEDAVTRVFTRPVAAGTPERGPASPAADPKSAGGLGLAHAH